MAKAEIRTSICVAEPTAPYKKLRWRRIADLARVTSNETFFLQTSAWDPKLYLDCKNTPISANMVKVLDWSDGAESEARVNIGVQIYELMECNEFADLSLYKDDAKIRKILKNGFFVHSPAKDAFSKGSIGMILAFGKDTGLVLDDKNKVII